MSTTTVEPSNAVGTMQILIVEDEVGFSNVLEYNLKQEGYVPFVAADGVEGLRLAQTIVPDLIILDLMLPSMNGEDVLRQIRNGERTKDIPIIILSAKDSETDQVVGFSLGCDDYVTKPANLRVLMQRIKAIQRRLEGDSEPAPDEVIEQLGVRIDLRRHRAFLNDQELLLTPTEFKLLEALVRQPGRAFSRQQLMDAAMGQDTIVLERTIDVHIKTLRKKLEGGSDLIETVRGVGYRFSEQLPD